MSATTRPATETELLRMPKDGRKYELVDGAIRVSLAGTRHGNISLRLGARLLAFATEHNLGHVFDSSTGFRLPGGNVRSPDVSFVSTGRFPAEKLPEGFAELAPDLAVEVLSPEDRSREVLDKVGEYLQAGVRQVWIVDPGRKRAAVYRSLSEVHELSPEADLEGGEVLPGFSCPLADLIA